MWWIYDDEKLCCDQKKTVQHSFFFLERDRKREKSIKHNTRGNNSVKESDEIFGVWGFGLEYVID